MSGLMGLSQKKNGIIDQFTSLGIDDNATSNALTIDASENVTITDGAHDFDVASHDTSNGLKLGGTLVTATAAELNYLDTTSGTPGVGTFLRGDKTWQAAGSTSASDLDSGTLATARMAVGTIIQVVEYPTGMGDIAHGNSVAGTGWLNAVSGGITLSSATNKIVAWGIGRGEIDTGANPKHAGLRLRTSGSGTDEKATFGVMADDVDGRGYGITVEGRHGFERPVMAVFSPDLEGETTVYLEGKQYSTSWAFIMNHLDAVDAQSQLILMEVVAS